MPNKPIRLSQFMLQLAESASAQAELKENFRRYIESSKLNKADKLAILAADRKTIHAKLASELQPEGRRFVYVFKTGPGTESSKIKEFNFEFGARSGALSQVNVPYTFIYQIRREEE